MPRSTSGVPSAWYVFCSISCAIVFPCLIYPQAAAYQSASYLTVTCLFKQIFELLQGYLLFIAKPGKDGSCSADDTLLATMIELLGPIPPDMLSQGTKSSKYFDNEGMSGASTLPSPYSSTW
jgi:hypothetical protein